MFSDDYTMAQSAMKHIEKSEIGRGIDGEKEWGRKSFGRRTGACMPQCVCVCVYVCMCVRERMKRQVDQKKGHTGMQRAHSIAIVWNLGKGIERANREIRNNLKHSAVVRCGNTAVLQLVGPLFPI